jgi:hypothetical protein
MAAENIITFHEPDKTWVKDPDDVEKFTINWANWLKGDTISSTDWYSAESTSTGLTLTETNTTTTASATISGGYHGGKYVLSNRIVTAAGLTKEKKLIIQVIDSEYRRLCN